MADATTPYWDLIEPEVGSSRDSWGNKWNDNLTKIDKLLQSLQPIGGMIDFAGAAAPTGWLLCDGTLYTVAAYPRLFAAIGNRYGGDGVTNFAVPDTRGRSVWGVGSTSGDQGSGITLTLGQRAGDWSMPILQANLPNYTINTNAAGLHGHPGSVSDITGAHAHNGGTDIQGDHQHAVTLPNIGTGVAAGGFSVLSDVFGYGSYTTTVNGAHWHNFFTDVRGDHQHALAISSDGNHSHAFSLGGSGVALRILPPLFAATKIICSGPPDMQTLGVGAAGAGTMTLFASPLRGLH